MTAQNGDAMGVSAGARRGSRGLWLANLLLVAGLVSLAVLATWLDRWLMMASGTAVRTGISLMLALLPPFLWLMLFYRLDRAEPEPLGDIGRAALFGALVQQAVCVPLLSLFPHWTSLSGFPASWADAGGVFAVSAIRISCMLLVLRWGVMSVASFNEKTDGILYGSAIGLGLSAAINVAWVLASGGLMLSAAIPRMVVTSLIHASLGGLGGYWFGLSAFSRQPVWRLFLKWGLLSALGAGLQILPAMAARQGFLFRHLIALLPTAAGALLIFSGLLLLLRRAPTHPQTRIPCRDTRRDSVLLVLVLVLSVVSGLGISSWQARLVPVAEVPSVQLAVPANWKTVKEPDLLFSAGSRFSGGTQEGRITVSTIPMEALQLQASLGTQARLGGEEEIRQLAAWWTIRHAREASWWKPISTEFLYRDDVWMAVITSLRLEEGRAGSGSTHVLRQSRDLIWRQEGRLVHLSLYAVDRDGTPDDRRMSALVASVRPVSWDGEGGVAP